MLLDLYLYVLCFVDRCLSIRSLSFGHCAVSSSIYGFWLTLLCFQTFLTIEAWHKMKHPFRKHVTEQHSQTLQDLSDITVRYMYYQNSFDTWDEEQQWFFFFLQMLFLMKGFWTGMFLITLNNRILIWFNKWSILLNAMFFTYYALF